MLSLTALWIALKDRRASLYLRKRNGKWCVLHLVGGGNYLIDGVIEVYNPSSRANAIRAYEFFRKEGAVWKRIETERFITKEGLQREACNQTPLTLQPYSGAEVPIMAMLNLDRRPEMLVVRVSVEDLFGKHIDVEIEAVW